MKLTDRQQRTYQGLIRLHTQAIGPHEHFFSADRVAGAAGIHRRSAHNDLNVLVGLEKVRIIDADGKRCYAARGHR